MKLETFMWLEDKISNPSGLYREGVPDEFIPFLYDESHNIVLFRKILPGLYRINRNPRLKSREFEAVVKTFCRFVDEMNAGPSNPYVHYDKSEEADYVELYIWGRIDDSLSKLNSLIIENGLYSDNRVTLLEYLAKSHLETSAMIKLVLKDKTVLSEMPVFYLSNMSTDALSLRIARIRTINSVQVIDIVSPIKRNVRQEHEAKWALYKKAISLLSRDDDIDVSSR